MLSKSDLQSLLQCPRKLWLERKKPELTPADNSTIYRRATDGNIVGEMAREQLGTGYLWPPTHENKGTAAEQAKTLLAASPQKPAAV
jgi:CRISPR/Cas system-associated exonuclease Cas4 (RecB family)